VIEFVDFIQSNPDELAARMTARATQTNEVTRCAASLPPLANLDIEIALLDRGGRDQRQSGARLGSHEITFKANWRQ
jgi:hypothetical protein